MVFIFCQRHCSPGSNSAKETPLNWKQFSKELHTGCVVADGILIPVPGQTYHLLSTGSKVDFTTFSSVVPCYIAQVHDILHNRVSIPFNSLLNSITIVLDLIHCHLSHHLPSMSIVIYFFHSFGTQTCLHNQISPFPVSISSFSF